MTFTVSCPKCGMALTATEADAGKSGQCPRCATVFPLAPPAWQTTATTASAGAPPPASREAAREAVRLPGIFLLACSILDVVLNLGGVVWSLMGFQLPMPPRQGGPDLERLLEVLATVATVASAIAVIVSALTAWAAVRMLQLRSYGLAVAASILQIIPCTHACCILNLPFGIWALIVLNRAEVRDAFQAGA